MAAMITESMANLADSFVLAVVLLEDLVSLEFDGGEDSISIVPRLLVRVGV